MTLEAVAPLFPRPLVVMLMEQERDTSEKARETRSLQGTKGPAGALNVPSLRDLRTQSPGLGNGWSLSSGFGYYYVPAPARGRQFSRTNLAQVSREEYSLVS